MKKTITVFCVFVSLSSVASADCGQYGATTYCAEGIAFEESRDRNGNQRYFLSELFKVKNGVKSKVTRKSNRNHICKAIIASFHSPHLDSILKIRSVGLNLRKDTVNCKVKWIDED